MRLGSSIGGRLLSSLHLKIARSLWGFQLIPSDSTAKSPYSAFLLQRFLFGVDGFFPTIYGFVSDFLRGLNEVFALLRHSAVLIGNY